MAYNIEKLADKARKQMLDEDEGSPTSKVSRYSVTFSHTTVAIASIKSSCVFGIAGR